MYRKFDMLSLSLSLIHHKIVTKLNRSRHWIILEQFLYIMYIGESPPPPGVGRGCTLEFLKTEKGKLHRE